MHFGYIGRPERASPGEGYPAAHIDEQNRIVTTAIDLRQPISQYPRKTPGERWMWALWRRFLEIRRAAQAQAARRRTQTLPRPRPGSRFSLNALAPSLASSEANTGPVIAPCFSHISALDQSNCSCRICLEATSASGPFLASCAGELERDVDGGAGLGQAVDDAELVEALGGHRVAGERQLHDDVVGHAPRQPQQRAAGGHERALGLGDPHFGALGGDDQIAGERDLHAAGDGEALDRRDQRLARRRAGRCRRSRGRRTRATRP